MSFLEVHGKPEVGILPLRHDGYNAGDPGFSLHLRACKMATSVIGRRDKNGGLGEWSLDRDKTGDIAQAFCWPTEVGKRGKRPIPGWAWAWPSTLASSSSDVITGSGGAGACGIFTGKNYALRPLIGAEYLEDARWKDLPATLPKRWKKLPVGTIGITLAATNEEEQIPLFFPCDPNLIAVNHAGDHDMGTLVADLTPGFAVDPHRLAPLQTLMRVIKKPLGQPNSLGLQLAQTGCGKDFGGYAVDIPSGTSAATGEHDRAIGRISYVFGGPLEVGNKKDKHYQGKDADGNPIMPMHITTRGLFRRNNAEDGPLRFESEYQDGQESGKPVPVHLGWTGADWAWWVKQPIYLTPVPTRPGIPEDPNRPNTPTTTTTTTPVRPPVATPGTPSIPGLPGAPAQVTPNTESVDDGNLFLPFTEALYGLNNHSTTPSTLNLPHLVTTMETAFPSVLAKAQSASTSKKSYVNSISPSAAAHAQASQSPITGQWVAWGAEGGPIEGVYGNTQTGASGDPWVYTKAPGKSKYPEGTASGGWVILPPEVNHADHANGYAPPQIALSTTYLLSGPGAYFGAGIPELSNGSIQDGWSWGMDTATGDLLWRTHSNGGAATTAMKFDLSDGNLYWKSSTPIWGILDHNNATVDRTWTFPDRSGIVALSSAGAFTEGAVIFANSVGDLAEDSANFLYTDATNSLKLTGFLNVGATTGANAANMFAVGTLAGARMVYEPTPLGGKDLILYDSAGAEAVSISSGTSGATVFNAAGGGISFTIKGEDNTALFNISSIAAGRVSSTVSDAALTPIYEVIQASTGDAGVRVTLSGGASYYLGIDNSGLDAFVIAYGSAGNAEAGTDNRIVVTTAGDIGFGTNGPDAKVDILSTSTQLRLTHTDGTVYSDILTNSSGDLTLTPSAQQIIFSKSSGAATNRLEITNTENVNATSHASLRLFTGGGAGGNPYIQYGISGVQNWSTGVDNAGADSYKVAAADGFSSNVYLTIATTGATTIDQWLNVGTATGATTQGQLALSGNLILSAVNIVTDTTTGMKIGTSTTQKLGLFNATPVVQPTGIADADGTLADITTKFNTLLNTIIETLGLSSTV